jgi:clan AA aspartic protease (TIGR02281 family)
VAVLAGLFVLFSSTLAAGEIFRWTDAEGRVYFTQRLDKVPVTHRVAARRGVSQEAPRPAREPLPAALDLGTATPATTVTMPRGRSRAIEIPFQRMGSVMHVQVRLNDRVVAPFVIDTGASGVSLPSHLAEQLGVWVSASTPTITMRTANGLVAQPVVTLEAVELGGARVEGLRATVNPTMEVGLLGGTFFNNFVYQVDAAAGVIRLEANEKVRGGMTQAEWSTRFQELRAPLAKLDRYLVTEETIRKGERARLEEHRAEFARALDELEAKANRFLVPYPWRTQ